MVDATEDDEIVLKFIVKRLQIKLTSPENVLVQQGTEDEEGMFFVTKGEFIVQVKDRQKIKDSEQKVRLLLSGDHFGVSLVLSDYPGNLSNLQLPTHSYRPIPKLLNPSLTLSGRFPRDNIQIPRSSLTIQRKDLRIRRRLKDILRKRTKQNPLLVGHRRRHETLTNICIKT